VLMREPEQRRSIRCHERDRGPIRRDDRAVILGPAALVQLDAIEGERASGLEGRLDMKRLDEGRILRRRADPGVWQRQTGGAIAVRLGGRCYGGAEQALGDLAFGTIGNGPRRRVDSGPMGTRARRVCRSEAGGERWVRVPLMGGSRMPTEVALDQY